MFVYDRLCLFMIVYVCLCCLFMFVYLFFLTKLVEFGTYLMFVK